MKLLLDTHLLVWSAWTPKKISTVARTLINSRDNELYFSAANMWEIAIKQGLGRGDFQVDIRFMRRGLLDNGYNELSVTSDHAIATRTLPGIHKDPFDRILIAQAIVEGLTLLTADATVARYPGPIRKI
jgi:PIN domain nuclease of toxin-antitoxin system